MIYFDNAATTFPKPVGVIEEVKRCMQSYCGNAGRGAHKLSLRAAQKIFECRGLLSELFGANDADRVFFTPNATYGINAVIKGLLHEGDHVVISDLEHNAVYRPIWKLANEGKIEYDIFKTYVGDERESATRICASIARLLRPNTRMVISTHASNICSVVLPIKEIGAFCHRHGLMFVVDAAQSAGHEAIDIADMNIDALCLPGHKGLYGPQGSGAVILGKNISLCTLIEGGNGIDSMTPEMSTQAPERYEAGTASTPCIAGLYEGACTVKRIGVDSIFENERKVCHRIYEMLGNTKGVTLYMPQYVGSIALFNIDGISSEQTAAMLDAAGICVRGGYHCAALAHNTLGTQDIGAVRASFGMFNRISEADIFYRAVRDIVGSA